MAIGRVVPAADILVPLSGGHVGSSQTYAMQPINNAKLSEYALQFLGTFLLSSTGALQAANLAERDFAVRYGSKRCFDDHALSLIEKSPSTTHLEWIPRHGNYA